MFIFKVQPCQMEQLIALKMQHYQGSAIRAYVTRMGMKHYAKAHVIIQQ